ncbi:MAG: hypothetical protein M1467_08450 [Deltaproteobacteria bacterium]|nr:hypothetical protein [Deltaproteobacteria bacterium]
MKIKYLYNKKFIIVSILSVLLVKEVIQNFTIILYTNPALLTHRITRRGGGGRLSEVLVQD